MTRSGEKALKSNGNITNVNIVCVKIMKKTKHDILTISHIDADCTKKNIVKISATESK